MESTKRHHWMPGMAAFSARLQKETGFLTPKKSAK